MSVARVSSLTITQVDVLYVSQQIKRDLMVLSDCYPALISQRRVNELDVALGTLLLNDAVKVIGFAIVDPRDNFVYHELRYTISHSGTGPRMGMGGSTISAIQVPSHATFQPWVSWSSTMLSLPADEQRQIVQSTGWGVPGASKFKGRYEGTTSAARAIYAAGSLAAQAEEIRR